MEANLSNEEKLRQAQDFIESINRRLNQPWRAILNKRFALLGEYELKMMTCLFANAFSIFFFYLYSKNKFTSWRI